MPLLAIKPAHVTLLGLGGGALVHSLFHTLPDTKIDVVELRQAVIDVAQDEFFLPASERICIHCSSAEVYVSSAIAGSVELLLCDLFDASEASATQLDTVFYQRCKLLLAQNGWIAMNYHQLPSFEHPAIRALCNHFESVFVCVVASGNWVVLATNSAIARDNSWQRMQQPIAPLRRQLAFHSHRLIRVELGDNK